MWGCSHAAGMLRLPRNARGARRRSRDRAAGPGPDEHRQPAGQRAPRPGVPGRPARAPPASRSSLVGPDPERPNLVARLRGRADGPVLGLLSHVDTVVVDPAGWRHGPWSGDLDDGCVWGRGALDMKSQTAAEVVAACSLARDGWRPARGDLLVISASPTRRSTAPAPSGSRPSAPTWSAATTSLNEGAGESFAIGDERVYTVSIGEKGVFRFTLTTDGDRQPRVDADDRRQRAAQARTAAGGARRAAPRAGT